MNRKATYFGLIAVALIVSIASRSLDLSDFLSGFILGVSLVLEITALVLILRDIKNKKED